MYHARVLLASKPRKHDLQVKSGETVSIIRTTNCPKGKWLARDSQNKCKDEMLHKIIIIITPTLYNFFNTVGLSYSSMFCTILWQLWWYDCGEPASGWKFIFTPQFLYPQMGSNVVLSLLVLKIKSI